jgi:ABC-type sugar transport system substrate-binding protein
MNTSLTRRFLAAAAALAVAVSFAGCSSGGGSSPAATKAPSSEAPATAAPSAAPKDITIGFAVPVIANSYWKANADFATKMGEQLGVKVLVVDSQEKQDVQLKNVQDLIAQGADGVIFGPVTVEIGPRILSVCKEAGIVCATAARKPGVEPSAETASYYAGYVVGNDAADGAAGADHLKKAGVTKAVAMSGLQGNSVADARMQGFLDRAKELGIEVLGEQRPVELPEAGLKATQDFLARFPGPGFDGLWSFNDSSAIGAVSALEQAGALDKVKIAAIDGSPEGVGMVNKDQMVVSTGSGEWVNGGFALILIYDTIMGKPWGTGVVLKGIEVTKENSAAYKAQYLDQLPEYDAKAYSKVYNPGATADTFQVVVK